MKFSFQGFDIVDFNFVFIRLSQSSCDGFLLVIEVPEGLLPSLDLVEYSLNVVEGIFESLLAGQKFLKVIDNLIWCQPVSLFNKVHQILHWSRFLTLGRRWAVSTALNDGCLRSLFLSAETLT